MTEKLYQPQQLETEVQARWEATDAFSVTEDSTREKFYCLSMLPYPSGALHMGHVRNYTIGDVISRYQRMQGKNVLQPMGWDAFGLPAENAAIKHQTAPARWTYQNIEHMRNQLKRLGFAYDWSREVTTCKPEYYRWEQQMFTRLMEKGLVYRKNAVVNWDPVDQTVLANEQVVDGRGWRSGALVERREIPQWFLKITAYTDELLDELEHLPDWPEAVKTMQRNWIGRSAGAEFSLPVCNAAGEAPAEGPTIEVFTTRPDTSFGMTYVVLAPEHELVAQITTAEQQDAVNAFLREIEQTSESDRAAAGAGQEKNGVFTGAYALNPFTQRPVPVYLAAYVLMGYGTGAIMAVPGQDQRDWEFATVHGLPIIRTVQPPEDFTGEAYSGDGPAINSDWLDGLAVEEAKRRALEWLEAAGIGRRKVNYRLRDWGVSRQRYWGCPIPVIYCPHCDAVPVPEEDLPVVLPEDVTFMGVQSPLKADPDWRKTECPKCGAAAERETDTFDTFMESSWYYARYCCPDADAQVDERADYWLPVDQYIGGIEHAILHLLYFRFYHKLMRDTGLVSSAEPATRLLCQGMVVAETFYREQVDNSKLWFNPAEVDIEKDAKGALVSARAIADGQAVTVGPVEKMSKSKNNGVDPQAMIDLYGADTVRLFSMFAAPPDQSLEWSDAGLEGAHRFVKRVWRLVHDHLAQQPEQQIVVADLNKRQKDLRRLIHQCIAKVSDDLGRRQTFNTAIAAVMELSNHLAKYTVEDAKDYALCREGWTAIVCLLGPFTPHVCEVLWAALGADQPLYAASWPEADASALEQDQVTMVVQINGKLRARIELAAGVDQHTAHAEALKDANVQRFIDGKVVRKVIHVPDKLLNLVVG